MKLKNKKTKREQKPETSNCKYQSSSPSLPERQRRENSKYSPRYPVRTW